MLKLIIVSILVSAATASSLDVIRPRGVVSPVQTCGGVGRFLELRIDGCTTPPCQLTAGTSTSFETDFSPRNDCVLLGLRVFVVLNDRIHSLVDVPIPGSTVVGGEAYTIVDSLVPAESLRGENVELIQHIYCTSSMQNELCVECPARVA